MIILSAKNLSFSFGASPILSGASFALDESAHCGVVGVNGAGKSTLLQLISGDYAPDEGSVQLSRKLSVGFFRQGGEYGGVAAGGAEAMGAAGVAGAGAMGIAGVAGAGARAAGGAGATDAAGAWATGAAGAGAEVVASGAWATGAGATGAAAGGAGSSGAMGGAGSAGSGGANAYAGAGAGAGAGGAATIGEAVREVFRDVLDLEASMRRLEAELSAVPHGGAEQTRLMAKYDRARTLFELADGYEYESRIRGVLSGLDIGGSIGGAFSQGGNAAARGGNAIAQGGARLSGSAGGPNAAHSPDGALAPGNMFAPGGTLAAGGALAPNGVPAPDSAFAPFDTPISILSGGQKTRLSLALMLIKPPDLLLLDEPTNHLDIRSLEWLEGYLKNYRRAFVVVSHDRYFLDAVTTSTMEIEHRRLAEYGGPYSFYVKKKAADRAAQERLYANQQREIKRIEAFIEQQRRWNRERNIIAAESRQKALDRMEKAERPKAAPKKVSVRFNNAISGSNDVLYINGVSKAYGALRLFEPFSALVRRHDRILVLGPNGCGKSTLLRILSGGLEPDAGQLETGRKIGIGYYDQEHFGLSEDKAVLDEVYDENARLPLADIRGALAAFLFQGDDVFKKTGTLSGGEKARLGLVKLILSKANLLMLDEPTNHLDIDTRETLEGALRSFDGAILAVSHDRYFIRQLATRIFYFEGGRICDFQGGYDAYLAFMAARREAQAGGAGARGASGAKATGGASAGASRGASGAQPAASGAGASYGAGASRGAGTAAPVGATAPAGPEPGAPEAEGASLAARIAAMRAQEGAGAAADWAASREYRSLRKKGETRLAKLEAGIDALEKRLAAIEAEMSSDSAASDHVRLTALSSEHGGLARELDGLMRQWEELSSALAP